MCVRLQIASLLPILAVGGCAAHPGPIIDTRGY